MSPAHVTVAPLAEHLPGWLLLFAFVGLVCLATAVPMGLIATGRRR